MISVYQYLMRVLYRLAYRLMRLWWKIRHPTTHGAAIALWHDDALLMVRTSYRPGYALPGGFANPAKDSRLEAIRECMEEVKIDCSGLELVLAWHGDIAFEDRCDRLSIWEGQVSRKPALEIDHTEIIWAGWIPLQLALDSCDGPQYRQYLQQKAAK